LARKWQSRRIQSWGRAGQSYEVVVDGCCHKSTFWIYKHPHNGSLTIEAGTEEADFRTLRSLTLVSLFKVHPEIHVIHSDLVGANFQQFST
jgi:hypothetical protein